jgi:hypothetical protein
VLKSLSTVGNHDVTLTCRDWITTWCCLDQPGGDCASSLLPFLGNQFGNSDCLNIVDGAAVDPLVVATNVGDREEAPNWSVVAEVGVPGSSGDVVSSPDLIELKALLSFVRAT